MSLWKAFSAYVAALADNEAELTGDVVRLLRRVDAEIKLSRRTVGNALTRPLSLDLVKQLVDAAREHGNSSPDIKQLGEAIAQEPRKGAPASRSAKQFIPLPRRCEKNSRP